MASVGESLLIFLGLDASNLEQGLKDAESKTKESVNRTAQSLDQMAGKWRSTVGGMVRMVAAPLAGALSTGAMIKSYFGDVAEAARLTGSYSPKLEEWRKKRAMLQRIHKEDIQLYIKGREAVTKFQISMADLSATFMRKLSPAFKWAIEKLNQFSDWVDRNQGNIIRFATVLAGVITGALTPAFMKLAVAMLANPLTWIIAGITALALVIDDLVTYLQGGESIIGHYWDPLIEGAQAVYEWAIKLWNVFKESSTFEHLKDVFLGLMDTGAEVFAYLVSAISAVFNACKDLFSYLDSVGVFEALMLGAGEFFAFLGEALDVLLNTIKLILGAIVALFTGDTALMSEAWDDLCNSIKQIFGTVMGYAQTVIDAFSNVFNKAVNYMGGLWRSFCESVQNAFNGVGDFIDGVIDSIADAFSALGALIADVFNFDGILSKLSGAVSTVKGWLGMDTDDKEITVTEDHQVKYTNTTEGLRNASKRDNTWAKAYANAQNTTEGLRNASNARYSTMSTTNNSSSILNDNKQVSVSIYPQTEAAGRAAVDEAYGLGSYSSLAAMGATR